jgi:sodium-dependent dicarboxylate transporter 2/3/5
LVAAAVASNSDPKLWMIPAALSASCAFMLPVATAPNAIVFGSGAVSTQQLSKVGFQVNLLGVVIITLGTLILL